VLGALPLGLLLLRRYLKSPLRLSQIPPTQERVLILGSTSGVGRTLAHQYARRGARVCLVGRRQKMLEEAAEECRKLYEGDRVLSVRGDCGNVEDMVKVRDTVIKGIVIHVSLHGH
jgi:short-subunit dehydrogenase